jgi:hypothetical protein
MLRESTFVRRLNRRSAEIPRPERNFAYKRENYYKFRRLWCLQTSQLHLSITTSIIVETILLKRGVYQLSWHMAARTAMGMRMVLMVAMEAAEHAVDYDLTGGVVTTGDLQFWLAVVLSIGAGYLAPLPYNYLRLRKYGKACH